MGGFSPGTFACGFGKISDRVEPTERYRERDRLWSKEGEEQSQVALSMVEQKTAVKKKKRKGDKRETARDKIETERWGLDRDGNAFYPAHNS